MTPLDEKVIYQLNYGFFLLVLWLTAWRTIVEGDIYAYGLQFML
jgi:hypothetical protein